MAPSRRPGLLPSVVASTVLFVAACGGSSATTPITTSASAAPPPSEQATPEPAASLEASTAPSPGASLAESGRIVDQVNGYALTLPDGWIRLNLTEEDLEMFLRTGTEMLSPGAADQLEGQVRAMMASGIDLFAMNMDALGSGIAENVNVIASPTGAVSIDLLEQIAVGQLEAAFPDLKGDIQSERVTLPAGDALHISYSVDTEAPDGSKLELTIHQYLVPDEGTGYFVTVTGPATDEFAAQALEIAGTLELLD